MKPNQKAAGTETAPVDLYRELFERSADAILIIDGDTFVDCNQATVDMLRYRNKTELLQTHPSELSPERQPDGRPSYEKANEMIAAAFAQGSHRFEWNHVRADGEVFPVEVLLTSVPHGERNILHCVWRDITDRKRLEAELRQALKMEAIGKLSGGIAHDFNNLLVAILGHAELLRRQLEGQESCLRRLSQIQRAGNRAASLVSQLLAFSRKQVLQAKVLDLNAVLDELHGMFTRLLGEDIQVDTLTPDRPLYVKADPGQLEQMILNLATNARDAMPHGGTLTFETKETFVRARTNPGASGLEEGRYAELTVADTGSGIPRAIVDKIFDPFFTTKKVGEGTGLGLSTVHGIVKQSGGDITVSSAPGGGTVFTIHLPLTAEAPPPQPQERPDDEALGWEGTEVVLVVEDEPAVAGLIESVLTGEGYTVHRAGNGREALDLIRERKLEFDLLLTDVVMPRMGGADLAREVRRLRPGVRILFSSGYADGVLGRPGALDGELDVELLPKPFTPQALLERVREVLDRG